MANWLYKLLGIDPGQDTLTANQVFFVQPWPWVAAGVFAVLVLAWTAFFYHRDGSRPSWLWKGIMVALRLSALAILVALAWQPMLRGHRTHVTPSVVAVLVDESRSMSLTDRWQDSKRKADLIKALSDPNADKATRIQALERLLNREDAALLRNLMKRHTVRIYRFGDDTRGKPLQDPTAPAAETVEIAAGADAEAGTEKLPFVAGKPAAEQTRLGNAIDAVLTDLAGQPVAALVLLSDGGQNMGADPSVAARNAAQANVPIHTVGFGDPTPPRDVAITSLLTDEVLRKGDEVVVSVGVRHRGFAGRPVPLTLRLDGKTIKQQSVTLGKEGEKQEINIAFTPTAAGSKTLVVSVAGQTGELTVSNNRKSFPVRIVDKKLKILYVEGHPRWEYRYLKNAILRDTSTIFQCLLVDADPSLGGEGNHPIYGFPKDRKALFTYDIIILGDVPRDFFTATDMKNLVAFVEERGGSLVTMAGELYLPWQYRGTDLANLFPIEIPATRREIIFKEPFQLELTEDGARNPMLFLVSDIEQNRRLWHSLPGMYWCGVAERAKPGATVLAQHPTQSGPSGKIPLMAIQQVGEGTSFMTMVDSTWQWRFRVGDKYFYRFWGQVLRSMIPHELPTGNRLARINTDRSTYSLGERVVLRARLLTPNFHPVRVSHVTAEMLRSNGQRFPVRLEPVPGAAGVYSGEWLPQQAGEYRAALQGANGQRSEAATSIVVEATSLELDEPQQNETLLRRVASLSGGKYLLWSEVANLPELIPDRRQEVQTRVEHELWDTPLPLLLFTLLLVTEWVLRKRKGLL